MTSVSSVDASHLALMFGQLTPLLIGRDSFFTPKHWAKSNIHVLDETSFILPTRDNTQFGGTVIFSQPKRATLQCEYVLEVVLSNSTLTVNAPWGAASTPAAYVNDLGDQLIDQVTHRYGSNILQQYPGEYAALWNKLTKNEIQLQSRNALAAGGLPLSGQAQNEQQRRQMLVQGVTVYCPLDRLWFVQNKDEAWTPEALATQGEIQIQIQRLEKLVYNATQRIAGVVPSPFVGGAPPTIRSMRLWSRDVILTVPEKNARLQQFEGNSQADTGMLVHFLDMEQQRRVVLTGTGGAGNREFIVKLDNIRLDMQELFFIVRRGAGAGVPATGSALEDAWSGDPLQAPVYSFAVEAAPVRIPSQLGLKDTFVDVLVDDVVSFRLEAGGKRLFDDSLELLNRTWHRGLYHPTSQPREPIYHKSFSILPEETKITSGFLPASNLGNFNLVITMPDFPANQPRVVDVFVHGHNIIQMRRGDAVKSMK